MTRANMKREAFARWLEELAKAVRSGDSLEGRVRYEMSDYDDEEDSVVVDAMVRTGNLEGTGGWTSLKPRE